MPRGASTQPILQLAIIDVEGAIVVYGTQEACVDNADLLNGVQVFAEDVFLGILQGKAGEVQQGLAVSHQFQPFFFRQWLGKAACDSGDGVNSRVGYQPSLFSATVSPQKTFLSPPLGPEQKAAWPLLTEIPSSSKVVYVTIRIYI